MIWFSLKPDSSASSVDSSAENSMHSLRISSEVEAEIPVGVLLHLGHHQLLIERAAVDADTHRLAVVGRHLADGRELLVPPLAVPTLPGLMRYLSSAWAHSGYGVSRTWPL